SPEYIRHRLDQVVILFYQLAYSETVMTLRHNRLAIHRLPRLHQPCAYICRGGFKTIMMSSLADMEIFARVVTTGSMSAAARDLGLSPAVVSKRLGRLEERLGTRLLQRTTRQIALTEAG